METGVKLKSILITIAAVLSVIILTVSACALSGKVKKAEENAEAAENAAAAYASALAESNAKADSAELLIMEAEKAAAAKDAGGGVQADYGAEARLYADFTGNDSEVRTALSALKQDDPDLIKNYRIRVDLDNMETVKLSGSEVKRVRFTGTFTKMTRRKDALIRVISDGGSFRGKLYIAGLLFDDSKSVDLGGLSEEDLRFSHGSALRSVNTAKINGENAVVCEAEFTGNSEDERLTVDIPLGDLDSSGFSKVYYDLYFEGEDSGFRFTTGCDFTGQKETTSEFDGINEAFAIYRSKAAAGQDAAEAKTNVLSAIDRMRSEMSGYSENDPLVVMINESLDKKQQLLEDIDTAGSAADQADGGSAEEGSADKKDTGKEENNTAKNAPAAVSTYTPAASEKSGTGVFTAIIIICTVLAIFMIILLFIMHGISINKVIENDEEERVRVDREKLKDQENDNLKKNLVSMKERTAALKKKIAAASGSAAPAVDTGALYSLAESIGDRADSAYESIDLTAGSRGSAESAGDAGATLREAARTLENLSKSGDTLGENINSIVSQLEETSESVKDINKAATIISDVASETNLLSLNASIEAARAGEAGRGFAVVAGEIQKLAEQTEKSVQEISDTVEKLNSDFRKTHEMMQDLDRYAEIQNESLDSTKAKFAEVQESLNGGGGANSETHDTEAIRTELLEIRRLSDDLKSELSAQNRESTSRSDILDEIREELDNIKQI